MAALLATLLSTLTGLLARLLVRLWIRLAGLVVALLAGIIILVHHELLGVGGTETNFPQRNTFPEICSTVRSVSYTHLDVYKRQSRRWQFVGY